MIQADNRVIPPVAKALGYAGVMPFAVLALVQLFTEGEFASLALQGFLAYGAVILSFLGGIRWGVATRFERLQAGDLVISVLPSLWAFACLLWPESEVALWGLLLGFVLLGLSDWFFPATGGASWMIDLRARLSAAVVAFHFLMITNLIAS